MDSLTTMIFLKKIDTKQVLNFAGESAHFSWSIQAADQLTCYPYETKNEKWNKKNYNMGILELDIKNSDLMKASQIHS